MFESFLLKIYTGNFANLKILCVFNSTKVYWKSETWILLDVLIFKTLATLKMDYLLPYTTHLNFQFLSIYLLQSKEPFLLQKVEHVHLK